MHLNDGAGEMETTFRLESEKYPELNRTVIEKCEDGRNKLYIKKDWIAYQKEALEYGVEVIPEIDSPSHCGAIGMASQSKEAAENGFENIALNSWQLDLRGDIVRELANCYALPLVDTQEAFDLWMTHGYSAQITWDRVHPNYIGCALIEKVFMNAVGFDWNGGLI